MNGSDSLRIAREKNPTGLGECLPGGRRSLARCAFSWIVLSRIRWGLFCAIALSLSNGCAERLPDDIAGYRNRCLKLNDDPIAVTDDDPHQGSKNVYACGVDFEFDCSNACRRPFPDGTIMVKESTRDDSDYAWLIATARKLDGRWHWNEYSRNFENEEFVHILPGEDVCIDCHKDVEVADWIFTSYSECSECRAENE